MRAGESVAKPDLYFANNVTGTINLLNAMARAGVKLLVFSSTCAVYGQPSSLPVTEAAPTRPENPYGESKLLVERMLPWYVGGYGLRSVSLRYFNAAGGSLDGVIGDDSRPASRLIPLAMKTALGQRATFEVLGTDYPTADGTCIRDYVHVLDLADAHVRSLEYLASGGKTDFFNVGVGAGLLCAPGRGHGEASLRYRLPGAERCTPSRAIRPRCTLTHPRSAALWAGRQGTATWKRSSAPIGPGTARIPRVIRTDRRPSSVTAIPGAEVADAAHRIQTSGHHSVGRRVP